MILLASTISPMEPEAVELCRPIQPAGLIDHFYPKKE